MRPKPVTSVAARTPWRTAASAAVRSGSLIEAVDAAMAALAAPRPP